MREPIKAYLITDPLLYPKKPKDFYNFYKAILLKHKIHIAAYRDKTMYFDRELLEIFLALNKEFCVKSLLNSNIDLALKLGFYGVHCNGSQKQNLAQIKKNFSCVFFSAHSLEDIAFAEKCGIDGVTISPIFKTPNKGNPLGVEFLKTVETNLEVYALGGIVSQSIIDLLQKNGIQNFASIRYFLN